MTLREELIQVAAVAVAIVQDLDYGTTYLSGDLVTDRLKTRVGYIVNEVVDERFRQEDKWGPQHHSPEEWLAILAEEVGEAGATTLDGRSPLGNTYRLLEKYARQFLKERFGPDPE